jgi:hypothetical protein
MNNSISKQVREINTQIIEAIDSLDEFPELEETLNAEINRLVSLKKKVVDEAATASLIIALENDKK